MKASFLSIGNGLILEPFIMFDLAISSIVNVLCVGLNADTISLVSLCIGAYTWLNTPIALVDKCTGSRESFLSFPVVSIGGT